MTNVCVSIGVPNYWIPGPDDEETPNKRTKTIHIPLNQLFTVDALTDIVDQAQLGM